MWNNGRKNLYSTIPAPSHLESATGQSEVSCVAVKTEQPSSPTKVSDCTFGVDERNLYANEIEDVSSCSVRQHVQNDSDLKKPGWAFDRRSWGRRNHSRCSLGLTKPFKEVSTLSHF